MNKSLIYIVGATVLVGGGAYLFLKNKKEKDLLKLAEAEKLTEIDKLGGTTSGGTTSGGTTSGGTTTTDANLNLANATILASQRPALVAQTKRLPSSLFGGNTSTMTMASQSASINLAKKKLEELDKKLATLGYKVDAIGQLVKI
jgi:hypothetical protein